MGAVAILPPVAAHIALVIALYAWLTVARVQAARRGEARFADFRTKETEPQRAKLIANSISNQFEWPVLFHVLAMGLYVADAVTPAQVGLAWVFVFGRVVHAGVHTLSPNVRLRGAVFMINFLAVCGMWALFLSSAHGLVEPSAS
ncbi:MAG: MAPEG family protein [Maricaulaceae bacterium]|jgi:hypothetical protein